ncbi:solute carrier organic anion transporter family member 4A1-like isoform X2 [Amblyomma americanum]
MHNQDENLMTTVADDRIQTERSRKKQKKHGHKGSHQAPPSSNQQQSPRRGQSATSLPATLVSPLSPLSSDEGNQTSATANLGSNLLSPSSPPMSPPAGDVKPAEHLDRVDDVAIDGGQVVSNNNVGRQAANQAIETMSPVIFTDPGTSAKKQHSKKKHREAKQDCTVKAAEPLYENLSPDQEPTAQSPEEPTKTILPDPSVAVGGEQQVEHAPSADDTAPKDAQPADEPPDQIAGKKDKLHSDLKPGEVMIPPDHRSIRAMKDEHDDERDQWFGLLGVYPPFLQKYRTPRCALTVLCLVCFTRSFSMNGVMMVVLPSLERRYRMKSYESGMVLSSNDVASCLAMLPVSFLATQRHKPRFVGSGTAIMGLGNLVVAMAHFLSPPYSLAGAGSDTCPEVGASDSCTEVGSIRNFRFIMMAGQMLSGLGATPINTVTIAYLDENLPKKKSSLYIGIFNSMAIVGPSVGFIFAGYTLTYYVDITTDVSALGLTSKSPAWVGAWWMGFLVSAIMAFTLGLLTACFPKHLPGYEELCAEKKADTSMFSIVSMLATSDFGRRLTDLPKAIRRLLTNVPFMLLCFAMSFNQMFAIGITSMLTKFFQSQLGMPSARSAYLTGPIVLVGGGFGAVIGGALVSRWNLDYAGMMRLCMYNSCFSWFGVLTYLVNCQENTYATPEGFVGAPRPTTFDFQCNSDCNCTSSILNPICGADGVVYLSPCLAGCRREVQVENVKMYSDCSCVNGTLSEVPGVSSEQVLLEAVQATRSRCSVDCALLFPYLVGVFLSLSSAFLNAAPATAAAMRCVKPAERSLALGINTIIIRLLGSIPAPVILGGIVDQTCLMWHRTCGSSGNCIAYQNEGMARGMFYALAVMLAASMVLFYSSLIVYRRNARKRAERKRNAKLASKVTSLSAMSRSHSVPQP